ncbi:MAG: putative phage integrase [Conexibacter sp.]|nr:putative phage integrase [Conexibacter sp.]
MALFRTRCPRPVTTPATALVPVLAPTTALPHSLVTDADLLADFFAGLRPTSRRTYRQRLQHMAAWLGCPFEALPLALLGGGRGPATQLVIRYKGYLLDSGAAPSTVNVALSAVRSLVGMARSVSQIDWTIDVKGVGSQTYRDTAGPGVAAVRRLIEQARANPDATAVVRNVAIIRLLFDLALRCNELTTLELEHVELGGEGSPVAVHILGKGRRQRTRLTLPRATTVTLAAWMAARGDAPGTLIGLTNRGIAKLLERLAAKAKLGAVRPHGLRHTSITAALDRHNGDVRKVREFSRHSKVETLLRYDDNRRDSAGEVAGTVAELL